MAIKDRLVSRRQSHLKWRAFDILELALMGLCGILLFAFCSTVVFDIVTRTIGRPWLWLQEVTSTLFIYAIFFGAAVATRRNDKLYLFRVSQFPARVFQLPHAVFDAHCLAVRGDSNVRRIRRVICNRTDRQ